MGIERGLRVLSLATLAAAVWIAWRPPGQRVAETAPNGDLDDALARWTIAPPPRVHVALDAAPPQETRDWLRAIRRAGTPVSWGSGEIPALALEIAPLADPSGGTMIWIAAPAAARVAIGDAVAPIDSVVATAGGASVLAPTTTGSLIAAIGEHRATARARDTLVVRRVLVLGRATWEAKFVIAALEEAGWGVDARLSVAPGVEVTQGSSRAPDTSRHTAIVVLDPPSPATGSAVARYVRAGGGAILSGGTAHAPALGDIAVGRLGARVRASSIAFADDAPRRALGFLAIVPRNDGIVLEERGGRVAAAARRVEMGRVVQVGYDETWRWRLAGGAGALDAHRRWWSELVSSVAYRAPMPLSQAARGNDAPLARLVDALGPSTEAPMEMTTARRWSPSPALLFALVSVFLLAELASRRLRGAP
jgi:hypothetical protein